jgi:tetratricopeptide (TPR) repeat protein
MKLFKLALAAAGVAALGAGASAQQPTPPRALTVSVQERAALQALETAAAGMDRAAQDAALAAARTAARSAEARYALAYYQLRIGQARGDPQMTAQAVDALASSSVTPASDMPGLLLNQAARAWFAGEEQRADRLLTRAVELSPNDAVVVADLAQMKARFAGALRMGNREQEAVAMYRQAVTLLQRAIALQGTAGQAAPESWYQRALALAVEGRLQAESVAVARTLVAAYPSAINWRDALLVYRQAQTPDPALDLDIRRLMRAAQALSGERDYIEFAEALGRANLFGEVKAVLDEGVARGMLDANEAIVRQLSTANNRRITADRAGLARLRSQALSPAGTGAQARAAGDAHFGYGQHAEAAELYQAALQKGGEDPNLLGTRLGAALALAGRRAEAEAAFRAVTGPRADLAAFWLAWLARRPA